MNGSQIYWMRRIGSQILNILDRPFFVTFSGGLIIAIIGFTYQDTQKRYEIRAQEAKEIKGMKSQFLDDFANSSYRHLQITVDQNSYLLMSLRESLHKSPNKALIRDFFSSSLAAQAKQREEKPISSILFKARPYLYKKESRQKLQKYIDAQSNLDSCTNALIQLHAMKNGKLNLKEINEYDSMLHASYSHVGSATDSLIFALSDEIMIAGSTKESE